MNWQTYLSVVRDSLGVDEETPLLPKAAVLETLAEPIAGEVRDLTIGNSANRRRRTRTVLLK
jgi:hypothetical protein